MFDPTAYTYELPRERIAQRPVHPPESARMMVVGRGTGVIVDSYFSALPEVLYGDEFFVFNNSKVIPARFFGHVDAAQVELFLAKQILVEGQPLHQETWEVLARPARFLTPDAVWRAVTTDGVELCAVFQSSREDGVRVVTLSTVAGVRVRDVRERLGTMPIPPYIRGGKADAEDKLDYQTCFARIDGSVAAPTASLHFTPQLVADLQERGARCGEITLHVGLGSVRELGRGGGMSEQCLVSDSLWQELLAHRASGGRVVAVGTTVVRALESRSRGIVSADGGETDLILTPGSEFMMVDEIVTNFHQPGTSHLLLVEAFVGGVHLAAIYTHALAKEYRFLSYGDGMFLRADRRAR